MPKAQCPMPNEDAMSTRQVRTAPVSVSRSTGVPGTLCLIEPENGARALQLKKLAPSGLRFPRASATRGCASLHPWLSQFGPLGPELPATSGHASRSTLHYPPPTIQEPPIADYCLLSTDY
jgi:hypothetical protein